jgi:hypothetical protein
MRSRFQLFTAISVALWCLACVGPSTQAWAQASTNFYFPHLANGNGGGGTWQTKFIFVSNNAFTTSSTLKLFDDNGAPLVLGTTQGSNSTFTFNIPAYGTVEIETDGAGSVLGGWASAQFSDAVIGSVVFFFKTGQGNVVSVGVPSVQSPTINFVSPATDRTGIALTNIYNTSNTVDLQAFDPSGNLVASTELTLGPGHHIAKNLIDYFPAPSVPVGFHGSVLIFSANSWIAAIAIGFEFNSNLFVSWSYSNIAYDSLRTAYSGTFILVGGPNAPSSGTIELSNLEHFDSNMFTGNISTTLAGQTRSGTFLGTSDDFSLAYMLYLSFTGVSNRGLALAEQQSDGSFTGYIADDGAGNFGTFTVTPVVGAGYTLRPRGQSLSRTPKKELRVWGRSEAQP